MIVTFVIAITLLLTSCLHGMQDETRGVPNFSTKIDDITEHKLVNQTALDFSLRRDLQAKHLKIIIEDNYETLKDLNLCFCRQISFEKIKLDQWKKFGCLEKLNFACTKATTPIMKIISKNNPRINHLNISCCNKMNWLQTKWWTNFENLKTLNLGSTGITKDGFNNILKKNLNITHLDLHDCGRISLKNVFWQFLTKLESLSIGNTDITYDIINYIIKNNKDLKYLDLRLCKNIDWQYVNKWHNAQSLTALCLSATYVWPDYVRHILKQATNLKYVNVYGCNNISEDSRKKLETDFPECCIASDISDKSWEVAARIAAGKDAFIKKPNAKTVESILKKMLQKRENLKK